MELAADQRLPLDSSHEHEVTVTDGVLYVAMGEHEVVLTGGDSLTIAAGADARAWNAGPSRRMNDASSGHGHLLGTHAPTLSPQRDRELAPNRLRNSAVPLLTVLLRIGPASVRVAWTRSVSGCSPLRV